MQVATLFRETATLLGASMEAPEAPAAPQAPALKLMYRGDWPFQGNYHDGHKHEQHDDGYETASGGEFEMRHNHLSMGSRLSNLDLGRINNTNMIKYDPPPPPVEDPYSFVDDEQQHHMVMPPIQHLHGPPSMLSMHTPKKRGRKKKIKLDGLSMHDHNSSLLYQNSLKCLPDSMHSLNPKLKERKKHDRFNGMSEDEVSKRTLPDHLAQNLDIVIIGINPGLFAAYKGHHYAGPGNHFWKCLYLSGLTPEPMTADDDYKLLKVGIGFTNMVERATKGSADLTRKEIKEGSQILLEKLRKFRPKIAVFNGKLIFEVFSGKKDFSFGRQPDLVEGTNTYMWVMPSSSARCAQLPRAADKVPFYTALKKFRDYLNGKVSEIDDNEFTFSHAKIKNFFEPELKLDDNESGLCPYDKDIEIIEICNQKKDEDGPPKKKRGRPKKIKPDGEMKIEEPKPKIDEKTGFPKKKRGRPKKIKSDSDNTQSEQNDSQTHCFSPPIQSPTMQTYSNYQQQQQYNQNSQSPLPTNYHSSPLTSQGYSQSPQQPFTHSDLSSEISAAISSENNPESPTIANQDFEQQNNTGDDISKSPEDKDEDCHYSSPSSKKNFQNYDEFSTDSDSIRYPPKQINQDVTSKSLSGLESLVDQIPNITDNESVHNTVVNVDNDHLNNQYSENSYLTDYTRGYNHYNTSSASTYPQHSNFSVTSLANSSATDSTFSVNSLTSNYSTSNYNIMGPSMPPIVDSANTSLFPNGIDRTCRIDSGGNTNIPYPYAQYSNPYCNTSTGFYSPSHNIHMPSPNFPYSSSYSNSTYPQPPSYIPNHVLDRMKHDRMDIGYGGY